MTRATLLAVLVRTFDQVPRFQHSTQTLLLTLEAPYGLGKYEAHRYGNFALVAQDDYNEGRRGLFAVDGLTKVILRDSVKAGGGLVLTPDRWSTVADDFAEAYAMDDGVPYDTIWAALDAERMAAGT